MRVRLFPFVALVCLVAAPSVARPADADLPAKPTVVVRLESVENLMADFKYLAALGGKEEQARQLDGFLQTMLGARKIEGLDVKRPIYVYGSVSPNGFDSSGVALLPITEEKPVLDVLERFNLKPEKGDDGIYTLKPGNLPFDIYFRFAHKYAYVTGRDKSAIEKDKLIAPAQLMPGGKHGTASVLVRLDQVPDAIKQIAQGQIELRLADAQEKREPGETDAEHEFKVQALKHLSKHLSDVIKDGGDLTVRVNVDRKTGELAGSISLAGKPGSTLATGIADLGKAKSVFGSALSGDSMLTLLIHGALPEDVRKALGPMVDEEIEKGLKKEKDKAKREQGEKVLKVLAPSLKAGELDLVVRLLGPDKEDHMTMVGAAKVKDGADLDKAIRDVVKSLPEAQRSKVTFDAESAGAVKIHRIDAKEMDAKGRKVFGDNPFFFAISQHVAVVAGGPDGLSAVKDLLAAKPQQAPPFVLNASLAQLVLFVAKQTGKPEAVKAIQDAIDKSPKGHDQFRISVEGGDALTARINANAEAVKLIAVLGEKAKGAFKEVGAEIKKGDDK